MKKKEKASPNSNHQVIFEIKDSNLRFIGYITVINIFLLLFFGLIIHSFLLWLLQFILCLIFGFLSRKTHSFNELGIKSKNIFGSNIYNWSDVQSIQLKFINDGGDFKYYVRTVKGNLDFFSPSPFREFQKYLITSSRLKKQKPEIKDFNDDTAVLPNSQNWIK